MGVAGLWEVLRPAGQVRSLTDLAVEDGFNTNTRHRGFRIGIDASIWFFHAAYGREGENPELRTLFFRCCRLLQTPLLPLFVFDGPNRPAVKRGKRVGGNAHWLTQGMKNIIDAFGFEWWIAPGEAEAELAYLNRIGIIDAVLSDDVDNFLFGATMVIRNPSNTLSGNRAHPVKNAQGKDDGNHVITYRADVILSDPSVALSRSGTILIGLLSGGDYIPAGLPGCGQKFATGLARAGFGDSLFEAVKELRGTKLDIFLDKWRQDVRQELKTNKSGLLPSKKPSLAASLPDDFPSLPVLMSYADPLTTEKSGKRKAQPGMWRDDPDPMRIAALCELYFEWGVKDIIVQRFRTVLWPGIVCRAVRRAIVDRDGRQLPTHFVRRSKSEDEEDEDTAGPSSPTKQISSTLSALVLSTPPKKSKGTSSPDPSSSEPFTLASLVPLTSPASPSSSRSTSRCQSPLLLEVLSQRTHASTDATLEYRLLVDPTILVERAESGVKGLRPPLIGGLFGIDPEDEDDSALSQDADEGGNDNGIERLETAAGAAAKSGTKKRKARREVPTNPHRIWLPASMIRAAAPALVEAYEEKVRVREEKKTKRGTKGGRGGRAGTGCKAASKGTRTRDVNEDGDELVPGPSATKTTAVVKPKAKAVKASGRRGKQKQASEAQDDAYEYFDLSAGESPRSSDEEGVKECTKGKAKTMQTDATMGTTKVGVAKTNTTSRKATTTSTVKESFKTTKPSTTKATKSKPSTSRPPAVKAPGLNPAVSRRIYEKEEEESTDVEALPPMPKFSRPLDIIRAKSKPNTAPPNPTSKSKSKPTTASKYDEESSSPSSPPLRPSVSKPGASSLPCRPTQPAPQTRKKPVFVDVSDSDSDIEVSDVRRQLSGTTGTETMTTHDEVGDMSVSVGAGKVLSTSKSKKASGRVVDGVIDLRAKRNAVESSSAPSMDTTSAPERLVTGASTNLVPGVNSGAINPTSISRSPSKLAHILLPQSALESDEEASDDELPTFHRGSAKSRTEKATTVSRPAPRPFPMQFASESFVSPRVSRFKERDGDDGDGIEIVDVFTTPRALSPPRSPIPNPSPIKSLSANGSTGPVSFVMSKQSDGFPTSPTVATSWTDAESHKKTKPRCRISSDADPRVSGNKSDGTLKSPRKSAAHSSPRHIPIACGRASSPTPPGLFHTSRADDAVLWTGANDTGMTSDRRRVSQPEDPGSAYPSHDREWRPRPSDSSAIYISSGSEDERDGKLGVGGDQGGDEAGAYRDQDRNEWTDREVDGWADTAMILSAPPSPASPELVPPVPAGEELTHLARPSKFKPAPPTATHPPSAKPQTTSASGMNMTHEGKTVAPRSGPRAPLLVARAKRSMVQDDNDIIDLTSD